MRKKADFIILILVIVVGFFAIKNAHAIGDWSHSLTYDPPVEVSKLADSATMSKKSKNMFYRFSPTLMGQTELDATCGTEKLGCTENRSIYILSYTNDKEFSQSTVTAAHEMLHVAYSRLSSKKKSEINKQLDGELLTDEGLYIVDKLKNYDEKDYYDEAHSFVGTEIGNISTELNEYYKQYFENRDELVAAYQNSP